MPTTLFRNARIYTPVDPGRPLSGRRQGALKFIDKGALCCQDGLIRSVGAEAEVLAAHAAHRSDREVECGGRCLLPGFVDPHTHMCFAATREAEFARRLQGASYLDILREGGGILSSVKAVRSASEADLTALTLKTAGTALSCGTTTVEIKSGYGLDTQNELKMLRVIDAVGRRSPLDVVATFMGAHAVPETFRGRSDQFVDLLVDEMIPAAADQGIARFCDVFCEEGVFDRDQSRRILTAARGVGLGLKLHADEVHDTGGAGLAAEMGAVSAEHLLAAGDPGLAAMAAAGVIAVLLPATAYSLRKPYARARAMVDLGLPLALASDCNPGSSFTESMPFVIGLAVLNMGLSPEESLVAATLNAAYAVGMAGRVGSLDVGKQADFLLLDGASPAVLAYHLGVSSVHQVYKRGELVAGQGC